MKIPKSDLVRFKKEFVKWQQRLGLTSYRVLFKQKNMPHYFAQLDVNEEGQIAVAYLCSEVDDETPVDVQAYGGPEWHGRHEVIHLLSHRIFWLAQQRYATEDEIGREWEVLVRRLEKVLK